MTSPKPPIFFPVNKIRGKIFQFVVLKQKQAEMET